MLRLRYATIIVTSLLLHYDDADVTATYAIDTPLREEMMRDAATPWPWLLLPLLLLCRQTLRHYAYICSQYVRRGACFFSLFLSLRCRHGHITLAAR